MKQKSYDDSFSLYVIPTPIGNLDDITIRALNTLKTVDIILCEDTRETGKLLKKYDISKKLMSCHEFNEDEIKEKVLKLITSGKNLGLVTDQGTPMISDPGYKIVNYLLKSKVNVISLPGATAFVPALTMSGINSNRFIFYGFLNVKSSKRKSELKKLKRETFTIIFYEAPHRIKTTLKDILEVFGNRNIAICRELSKLHEEMISGKITEVLEELTVLKGEFVLVVEGNTENVDYSDLDVIDHVKLYITDKMSEKDAIKLVAKERNVPKSVIYKEYHNRK